MDSIVIFPLRQPHSIAGMSESVLSSFCTIEVCIRKKEGSWEFAANPYPEASFLNARSDALDSGHELHLLRLQEPLIAFTNNITWAQMATEY